MPIQKPFRHLRAVLHDQRIVSNETSLSEIGGKVIVLNLS